MFHWFRKHDKNGLERPDTTPIELSLKVRPLTLAEQIARFVRSSELVEKVKSAGADTFDDANDFEVDEIDPLETSPYQVHSMHEEEPLHVQTRVDEIRAGMVRPQDPKRIQEALNSVRKKPLEPKVESASK